MASNRTRRITKEIADIRADTHSQITAEPVGDDDDVTNLRGAFPGPPGTPYEGGTYKIDIKIPTEYPFRPPVMKFLTKVWHPNVSSQTVSTPKLSLWLAFLIPLSARVLSVSILCHPPGPQSLLSRLRSSHCSLSSARQSPRIRRMPRSHLCCFGTPKSSIVLRGSGLSNTQERLENRPEKVAVVLRPNPYGSWSKRRRRTEKRKICPSTF